MRQEKIIVFSYEDLLKNDTLKEKVLDNWRGKNDYFDHDFILEDYKETLEDLGYNGVNIMYSGFYSQGDGACFTCESVDLDRILKRMKIKIRLGLKEYIIDNLNISIKHNNYRYYHYKSVRVDYDFNNNFIGDLTDNYCNEVIKQIIDFIDKDICTYSNRIYNTLESEWEYQNSDESILEMININDYEFTEDGKQFY